MFFLSERDVDGFELIHGHGAQQQKPLAHPWNERYIYLR